LMFAISVCISLTVPSSLEMSSEKSPFDVVCANL
jgi:hypothetical protein